MKVCAFTVADAANKPYADLMIKMFKHFNPGIEIRLFGEEDIKKTQDPDIFYRATPYFTRKLMDEGYDTVVKIDADTFIFHDLADTWTGNFDLGVVYNYNRMDPKTFGLVNVWDIPPQAYMNCGYVVMKDRRFVDNWWKLCNKGNFYGYRYREQDLMNIQIFYGDYEVQTLDNKTYWNGLVSKGENAHFVLKNNEVILPKSFDNYPDADRIITAYHVAGGNSPNKMNYRILFNQDIQNLIEEISHE